MTQTLVHPNHKPVADGWSRDPDGILRMDSLKAFQVFGNIVHGQAPAYAANLVAEPGMSFEAFIAKNGIEIPDNDPEAA